MTNQLEGVSLADLQCVTGGAVTNTQWQQTLDKAKSYCPNTVAKYQGLDPKSLNRSTAQQMGNSCVSEMGPFMGPMARPQINQAIDQAFPAKH